MNVQRSGAAGNNSTGCKCVGDRCDAGRCCLLGVRFKTPSATDDACDNCLAVIHTIHQQLWVHHPCAGWVREWVRGWGVGMTWTEHCIQHGAQRPPVVRSAAGVQGAKASPFRWIGLPGAPSQNVCWLLHYDPSPLCLPPPPPLAGCPLAVWTYQYTAASLCSSPTLSGIRFVSVCMQPLTS
jgi:hypothetical protein